MNTSYPPSLIRLFLLGVALVATVHAGRAQSAYSFHANPTTPTEYQVRVGNGCLGCQVVNPERAADLSATTAASLQTPLGLLGEYVNLRLRLTATVPAGSVAGVVVGSDRPLDLVALNAVRLRTYGPTGNAVLETHTGVSAGELKVIGVNRYVIEFTTTAAFTRVEIGLAGVSDAISTLDVYYAYGIPQGTTPLAPTFTSTFANPVAGTDYDESVTGICLLCGVSNERRAADQNLAANNFATIQTTVGALGSTRLRLRLNGVAPAGSVAGLVISTGSVLDLSVLPTLTIRTYTRDINGNLVLRETAVGGGLLQLNVLTGNRASIGFVTTEPFEYVELAVGGLVSALNTVQVYYAFGALGPDVPLPVTLVRFGARALPGGRVQLTWATASEVNSAAFIVERATDPHNFGPIGEPVAAAGTSAVAHTYELHDVAPPSGTLYYRLRQLDLDGATTFSDAVAVRPNVTDKRPTVAVWPTPAHNFVMVRLGGEATSAAVGENEGAAPAQLTLYDAMGRAVLTQSVGSRSAETRVPLDRLAPGRYVARVSGRPEALPVVVE